MAFEGCVRKQRVLMSTMNQLHATKILLCCLYTKKRKACNSIPLFKERGVPLALEDEQQNELNSNGDTVVYAQNSITQLYK
jgi:hypothetical protein